MTESEWLSCADPIRMLSFVADKATDRKLRLFAVGCSRQIWHLLDDMGRAAVQVAADFADGRATVDELRAARHACKTGGASACWYAAATNPMVAARNASLSAVSARDGRFPGMAQADLLRDLFGNPFGKAHFPGVASLQVIEALASNIYEMEDFGLMPPLALALADAGCTESAVLDHCRQSGGHARGCWVLDWLLGRR